MGDWGLSVGRNGAEGRDRSDVGRNGWGRAGERVARQGDAFFGGQGARGPGVGEGVRLGRPEDIGYAIWRTQGDGGSFTDGCGGRLLAKETVWAHAVI